MRDLNLIFDPEDKVTITGETACVLLQALSRFLMDMPIKDQERSLVLKYRNLLEEKFSPITEQGKTGGPDKYYDSTIFYFAVRKDEEGEEYRYYTEVLGRESMVLFNSFVSNDYTVKLLTPAEAQTYRTMTSLETKDPRRFVLSSEHGAAAVEIFDRAVRLFRHANSR